MSEELQQQKCSMSLPALTKSLSTLAAHSLKPSIPQPCAARTILLTAKSTTLPAQHKQVAGPLQQILQQKEDGHTLNEQFNSDTTNTTTPNEYAESIYSYLTETHRRLRYSIASIGKIGFPDKLLRTLKFFTDGCREAFKDAKTSSLRCRILARSMTRTMELIQNISYVFIDEFSTCSEEYFFYMSELVALYISCKLNCARDFKDHKDIICNRISNTIHRHLIVPDEEVTKMNLLRMFVFIPDMFEERMVMTTTIKKFLPKPPLNCTQQVMSDKLYIQYLIVFHQWKLLEQDLEQQIRVLNYANSFMRPSGSLRFNIHYNYYLPQYDALRTATKYILENLNYFTELRNASIKDNTPNNQDTIILDFEELVDESTDEFSFADVVNSSEIPPMKNTKPVKSEYEIVYDTIDLTCDNGVDVNNETDWLHKLQQRVWMLQTKPVCPAAVEVIEINSDSDDETDLVNVNEPELFSLDFVDFINSNENCPNNLAEDNLFDDNLLLENVNEDLNEKLLTSPRIHHSNIRTYASPKEKGNMFERSPTEKCPYSEKLDSKRDIQSSTASATILKNDQTLLNKDSYNPETDISSVVPNSHAKTNFSMPRIVDSFSYRPDSLHLLTTPYRFGLLEDQHNQIDEDFPNSNNFKHFTYATQSDSNNHIFSQNTSHDPQIPVTKTAQLSVRNSIPALVAKSIKSDAVKNNKIKKVKFNETPLGPTPTSFNVHKEPPKPAINKSIVNKHYKTTWQRFACLSPASSTSSSSTTKGKKERIEELPSLFSNYYETKAINMNNYNQRNENNNKRILDLQEMRNDPKLKQQCRVVIERDISLENKYKIGISLPKFALISEQKCNNLIDKNKNKNMSQKRVDLAKNKVKKRVSAVKKRKIKCEVEINIVNSAKNLQNDEEKIENINRTKSLICKIEKTSNIEKILMNRIGVNNFNKINNQLSKENVECMNRNAPEDSASILTESKAIAESLNTREETAVNTEPIDTHCNVMASSKTVNEISQINSEEYAKKHELINSMELSTEISIAASSLTLLANMAATTAPLSSHGEQKPTNPVSLKNDETLIPIAVTVQEPLLALSSTKINCDEVDSLPTIVYPVKFNETTESRNKEELLNIETTPTVPPYLFNGESRDVPTPTLPTLAEHIEKVPNEFQNAINDKSPIQTSDHEVSSTQEILPDTSYRNPSGILTKQIEIFSNAAMLVQNNQVDTTHHLPELSHNLRKRTPKTYENIELSTTESNVNMDISPAAVKTPEQGVNHITSNGGSSPSTTTANDEIPKKQRRRLPKNLKFGHKESKRENSGIKTGDTLTGAKKVKNKISPDNILDKDVSLPESINFEKNSYYYITKEGVRIKIITKKGKAFKGYTRRKKK
ncbi:uncharacterized protein LOC119668639 [Teleopsis dalmanni]|uniref:uncharacterized protein LOC119668639 n=1 Tax=Teleopsis dalmanni TaxID=139649 RepID=UPI0018CE67DF|nr:uncharacterized protein LOC119668639 [Teleopsis dalmanni]XP_037934144.1 uncharacterized protein LOC119668639 [Teleopsis dalmanni]